MRPIALMPLIWRVWAKLRYRAIRAHLLSFGISLDMPAPTTVLQDELLTEATTARGNGWMIAFYSDISRAFDGIPTTLLRAVGLHYGVPAGFMDMAVAMYGAPRLLRIGSAWSETLAPQRGIPQGCACACMFAGMMLQAAMRSARWMSTEPTPLYGLLPQWRRFVDDIVFCSRGQGICRRRHIDAFIAAILRYLSDLEDLGLTASKTKCTVLASSTGIRRRLRAILQPLAMTVSLHTMDLGIDVAGGRGAGTPMSWTRLRAASALARRVAFLPARWGFRTALARSLCMAISSYSASVSAPPPGRWYNTARSMLCRCLLRGSAAGRAVTAVLWCLPRRPQDPYLIMAEQLWKGWARAMADTCFLAELAPIWHLATDHPGTSPSRGPACGLVRFAAFFGWEPTRSPTRWTRLTMDIVGAPAEHVDGGTGCGIDHGLVNGIGGQAGGFNGGIIVDGSGGEAPAELAGDPIADGADLEAGLVDGGGIAGDIDGDALAHGAHGDTYCLDSTGFPAFWKCFAADVERRMWADTTRCRPEFAGIVNGIHPAVLSRLRVLQRTTGADVERVLLQYVLVGATRPAASLMHWVDGPPTPTCPYCREDIETISHRWYSCPAWAHIRLRYFDVLNAGNRARHLPPATWLVGLVDLSASAEQISIALRVQRMCTDILREVVGRAIAQGRAVPRWRRHRAATATAADAAVVTAAAGHPTGG